MENDLKLIFPQVVLHNFGIEFNQQFTGDFFNKLRARNIVIVDVFIIMSWLNSIPKLCKTTYGNVILARSIKLAL